MENMQILHTNLKNIFNIVKLTSLKKIPDMYHVNKKVYMPAPEGNQYGLALSDPQIRQKAYQSFCDHLAEGYSYSCWYFEEEITFVVIKQCFPIMKIIQKSFHP